MEVTAAETRPNRSSLNNNCYSLTFVVLMMLVSTVHQKMMVSPDGISRPFTLSLCCFCSHLNYSCNQTCEISRNGLIGTNVEQQPQQQPQPCCHLLTSLRDKAANNCANNRFIKKTCQFLSLSRHVIAFFPHFQHPLKPSLPPFLLFF